MERAKASVFSESKTSMAKESSKLSQSKPCTSLTESIFPSRLKGRRDGAPGLQLSHNLSYNTFKQRNQSKHTTEQATRSATAVQSCLPQPES